MGIVVNIPSKKTQLWINIIILYMNLIYIYINL